MMVTESGSVNRVAKALRTLNIPATIEELPGSTRTAQEAAAAVGCDVAQIVKSLVFQGLISGDAVLILTSGANQVDEKRVSQIVGEDIKFASADFVREQTGFAIGGVSPFGIKIRPKIYIDQDLLLYDQVWAAAGSHHAVFCIPPGLLVTATGGIPIQVK